jgi:hypothetical protein
MREVFSLHPRQLLQRRGKNDEVRPMRTPTQKMGTTRSGKAINIFLTEDWDLLLRQIKDYTAADHFDAWAVFDRLTVRQLRRFGEGSEEYLKLLRYMRFHREQITTEFIRDEKLRLGLATSTDLVRFAAQHSVDVVLD